MHTRGGTSDNEIENLNDDIISTEKYSRVAIEYFNIGDAPPLEGQTREWQSHNIIFYHYVKLNFMNIKKETSDLIC